MSNPASNQLTVKGEPASLAEFAKAAAGTFDDGRRTPLYVDGILEDDPAQLNEEPEKLVFYFYTAWTGPIDVVAAMARRFPALNFELVYSDECMGYAGVVAFEGERRTHFEEAYLDSHGALDILARYDQDEADFWLDGLEVNMEDMPDPEGLELLEAFRWYREGQPRPLEAAPSSGSRVSSSEPAGLAVVDAFVTALQEVASQC
jgi:hypothetical protein